MTLLEASLISQMVKNLHAMWETWVQPLGQEDSLENVMATNSSILAWRIPQTEEPGQLQSMWSERVRHDSGYTFTFFMTVLGFPGGSLGKESTCNAGDLGLIPGLGRSSGEGNIYPLQYSCLENPMDR